MGITTRWVCLGHYSDVTFLGLIPKPNWKCWNLATLAVAPSAGVLEKAGYSYLVMAKAVTAGFALLGLPLKATLTSSSRLRARFLAHLCPVESIRKKS